MITSPADRDAAAAALFVIVIFARIPFGADVGAVVLYDVIAAVTASAFATTVTTVDLNASPVDR